MNDEYYVKDGIAYERVTRIIDSFSPPELVEWKVRVGKAEANRVSKVALKFGSRVHELIEKDERVSKKDSEEVKNCMKAWDSWLADNNHPMIMNGVTLYDEARQIAGTPDFMVGPELVDIKTSREVKASHFIQLGGYASMMVSRPTKVSILRLDKQAGIYECVDNEKIGITVEQCIAAFNYLLGYYRFYNRVQSTLKPKVALPQGEIE